VKILVLNSGSSSLKCQYFIDQVSVASALVERIGEEEGYSEVTYKGEILEDHASVPDHYHALNLMLTMLKRTGAILSVDELDAVGHRVVHGGSNFSEPILITREVIETIRSLIILAPLHNPANLEGIEVIDKIHPTLPQVAVFDTAFHQTMPEYAALYPIPYELYQRSGIRRVGCHGTSHAYVSKTAARM
jgi:acetate kinase